MNVFITGGTKGIGHGLVNEFLKHGHKVAYTGTSQKSIDESIKNLSGDYLPLVCDVRNVQDLKDALKKTIEKYSTIDLWINNAGVGQSDECFTDLSETEIRKVVDTNVLGTMLGTKVAMEQMKRQNHGAIYNLEGLGSNNMIIPKTICYASTKRLITYFTKGVRKELKKEMNIFIGTIQPGMVFTNLLLDNMPENGMKIARIIGNDVEYATAKMYAGLMKRKRKVQVTGFLETTWRFMKSMFVRKKENEKD